MDKLGAEQFSTNNIVENVLSIWIVLFEKCGKQ